MIESATSALCKLRFLLLQRIYFFLDVLLLKLPTEFERTKYVSPIKLNNCWDNEDLIGKTIILSGYGSTETDEESDDLMIASQKIVKTDTKWNKKDVNAELILQGSNSPNGVSSCEGDSAGEKQKDYYSIQFTHCFEYFITQSINQLFTYSSYHRSCNTSDTKWNFL